MPYKVILRIDDVGRKPGDDPELGTDGDLSYFAEWRKAAGLKDFPVIYGVTPAWIKADGIRFIRRELEGFERLAVHGWDHRRGATVTESQMRVASFMLSTRMYPIADIYIPPFNDYSFETIETWTKAGGKYFLGGKDPKFSEGYFPAPTKTGDLCWYIPATSRMYGHAKTLQKSFYGVPNNIKVVATLHVPWDDFEAVREYVDFLRPYLVTIESVEE